jgi:hypothetical protein
MGTRLYPRTENPAVLEKLACVPSGTMRRLRATKAQLIATRKGVRYYLVAGKSELVAVRNHSDMEEVWMRNSRQFMPMPTSQLWMTFCPMAGEN